MANVVPIVPKSICKEVSVPVSDFFATKQIQNYAQPCLVYKTDLDLVPLKDHVFRALVLKYNNAYATSALKLFNLKSVNLFLRTSHSKQNRSIEDAAKEKELVRLSNVAAKARKARKLSEQLAKVAAAKLALDNLTEKADLADLVVARASEWQGLLFSPPPNPVGAVFDGILRVPIEGIVLLTNDEENLLTLKADVDMVFVELRGQASIDLTRCCDIVVSLEKIMALLRSHPTVQHLRSFLTITQSPIVAIPDSTTSTTPVKGHRGTKIGSRKWRIGDLMSARIGGLKTTNTSLRNKMTFFKTKLKTFHEISALRVIQEEKEITTKKAGGRKTLRFTEEEAKAESLRPTKMSELSDDLLQGIPIIKCTMYTRNIYNICNRFD